MPNWCSNELRIDKKYKDKLVNKENKVDFSILIPMPESLQVEAGSSNDTDMYVYLSNKFAKSVNDVKKDPHSKLINNSFSNDWIQEVYDRLKKENLSKYNINESYKRGKVLIDNYDTYGAINWYEWAWANWGVKWNANTTDIEEDEDELVLYFDTPWGPPSGWLEKLAEKKIPFELDWEEEGGMRGRISANENGEITDEELEPEIWEDEEE